MDAGSFEGLLYNMLSEEPFKNQRFDITAEKDDYMHPNSINMYVSYLSCKKTKLLKDDSFIIPLEEISHKEKLRPISHEKKCH